MNVDIEVCCLSLSPSLPLHSFTLPENVQLQFKPHCFIQAVCLNSFFIFIFPSRGRWGEAIVPQLLPILRWLTLKYKENSAKHRICKGERDLKRNHGNWSWFETKALLFVVGFVFAVCQALQTSAVGTQREKSQLEQKNPLKMQLRRSVRHPLPFHPRYIWNCFPPVIQ